MTTPTVRRATPADLPGAARAYVASWRVTYRGLVPDEVLAELDPDRIVRRWLPRLTDPATDRVTLVAAGDGGIIGIAGSGPYRHEQRPDAPVDAAVGEVQAIYVHPDRWGAGAGLALLTASVAEQRAAGRRTVRLWVAEANDRARRFYQRFGFRPDGERNVFHVSHHGGEVGVPELRYTLDEGAGPGAAGPP